jgi:hypothetical protein
MSKSKVNVVNTTSFIATTLQLQKNYVVLSPIKTSRLHVHNMSSLFFSCSIQHVIHILGSCE